MVKFFVDIQLPIRYTKVMTGQFSTVKQLLDEYRTIIQSAMDGFLVVDTRGRFLDTNDAYCELIGYSREELLTMSIPDIDVLESEDDVRKRIQGVMETGKGRFETKQRCKNGTVVDVEISTIYMETAEGGKFFSFIRDVTERKESAKALEWESRINASLAELGNSLIGRSWSIQKIADLVLEHACKLTGSQHGFVSAIDPVTGDNIGHTLTQMSEECGMEDQNITLARSDDGTYPALWGFALNTHEGFITNDPQAHLAYTGVPEGHIPLTRFLSVPVLMGEELLGQVALANSEEPYTHRHMEAINRIAAMYALALLRDRAQAELLKHKENLEKLVKERTANYREAEQQLHYRSDFERLVLDISTRFIGLKPEEVDRQIENALESIATFTKTDSGYVFTYSNRNRKFSMSHLWHSSQLNVEKSRMQNMDTGTMPWWQSRMLDNEVVAVSSVENLPHDATLEKQMILDSGVRSLVCVPMTYEGKVTGFLGLSSTRNEREWSITEISLLQLVGQIFTNTLQRARMQRQLKQSTKMEAIGTLAGGIAHDFNNILGIISGYAELAGEEATENQYVVWCLNHIRKATQRATDLVKRILTFSRRGEQARKLIKMAPIVKDAVKLLRSTLPTSIEIRSHILEGKGTINADATQLQQVIMNLCVNARDAMKDEGGRIMLTIEDTVLDEESLEGRELPPGNYRKLTVSDTGTGIPREVMEHIFEPYFTTKRKGEGSGLGLSVVHGIVKNHGGEVVVESTQGEGTAFHIYLPVREEEIESEAQVEKSLAGGDEHILMVDDEEALVSAGKRQLEKLGYRVTATTRSLEALELFRENPDAYDLLFTDFNMPQLKGDGLAQEILKIRPDTPVILCTGFASEVDEQKLLEAGIKKLLLKPLNKNEMAHSIRVLLDQKVPDKKTQ